MSYTIEQLDNAVRIACQQKDREIERLTREQKALVSSLSDLNICCEAHMADVERLTRERGEAIRKRLEGITLYGNEITRLRAALERVARWNEHFEYAFSQDIMEFAHEALQEPKP